MPFHFNVFGPTSISLVVLKRTNHYLSQPSKVPAHPQGAMHVPQARSFTLNFPLTAAKKSTTEISPIKLERLRERFVPQE